MDSSDARERAIEARRLLAAPEEELAAYRELPPEARGRRRMLDVLGLLFPDEPPSAEQLEDFRSLWSWVCRQDVGWETWEPGEPPTDDFRELVIDSCPSLFPDGHHAADPNLEWLSSESAEGWVVVGHGHDGHLFLFWDSAQAPEMALYRVDNQDHDLVTGAWIGVEEILRAIVIEHRLHQLDPPPPPDVPLLAEEIGCMVGCGVLLVSAVALMLYWLLV